MAIESVSQSSAARQTAPATDEPQAAATASPTPAAAETAKPEVAQGIVDSARQAAAAAGDAMRDRIDGSFMVAGGKKTKPCGPKGGRCSAQGPGPVRGLGGGDGETQLA